MRRAPVRQAILRHGVGPGGVLVGIDEVGRGRSALGCPYCGTALLAKKGRIVAPHFAHDGPTCRESAERQAGHVPFHDDLETVESLAPSDLKLCAWLDGVPINESSLRGWRRAALRRLVAAGLIEVVPRGQRWVNGVGSHRHSDAGRQRLAALRGRLSLVDLAVLQEAAMLRKLERLEAAAAAGEDPDAATDLRLYRAQLARVLALDLYFLEVRADDTVLHKIGVTSRRVDERLGEIRTDLAPHLGAVQIEVRGVWPGRGCLEHYFKRVFARRRAELGNLTEYFNFDRRPTGGRLLRRPSAMLAELEPWKLPPRLEALRVP